MTASLDQQHPLVAPRRPRRQPLRLARTLLVNVGRTQATIAGLQAELNDPNRTVSPPLLSAFDDTLQMLKLGVGVSQDLIFREWRLDATQQRIAVIYVNGLIDAARLAQEVISPLLSLDAQVQTQLQQASRPLDKALQSLLPSGQVVSLQHAPALVDALLNGAAIVLLEGCSLAVQVGVQKPPVRSVEQTTSENVLRGPKDAFNESLDVNVALIRRRVRDTRLTAEEVTVGRLSKTRIAICSIGGVVNPVVLARVRQAIEGLDVDGVADSGQLANMMYPSWFHFFPMAISTERPDRVALALWEGRIAVVMDTSPFVLIYPSVYVDFFRSVEDLYLPWVPATLLRVLRLLADHVSALAPAFYVAIAQYNPGVLQPQFALVLASSRALVPYSPFVEALIVLALIEFLVEAAVRSPKAVGNAVPIVGGIIIGQVLTKTHLASEVMVVTGALAAITQFTAADPSIQIVERANKYWFLFWAGWLGFFGIMVAVALELAYLGSLKSVGIPYFSPIGPLHWHEALDVKLVLPPRWRPARPASMRALYDKGDGELQPIPLSIRDRL